MTIVRRILGVLLCCVGIASAGFGVSLVVDQQSWLMVAGLGIFAGFGYLFFNLGYALVTGRGIRTALISFLIALR
jgi:hypothetical protein